ncbi:hypothetical protein GCM10029992_54610 [Glycomyces albus]
MVGIVGASRIGRAVIGLLADHGVRTLIADPYLGPREARELGAEPVGLDDLCRRSDLVSLHAPALPETAGMIDARRLALLRDGAALINTARGSLVDTAALTAECATGRISAVLDVTDPEPLPPDHPLLRLPNVFVTPTWPGRAAGNCADSANSPSPRSSASSAAKPCVAASADTTSTASHRSNRHAAHLAGQPLRTRDDLADAFTALARPVAARLSDGRARVRLGATGAHFPDAAAELEGFARPLWGLAPLAAGGGDFDPEPYLRGLDAGTDPGHPEYWGPIGDHSQRCVEAAAIGFALALAPERFWEPLPSPAKDRLARWLAGINHARLHDNNWLFFRVLVGLGLRAVGAEGRDREAERAALDRLETFATGDGWYTDGPTDRADYYTPWAMHLYGLVYARLSGDDDPDRARRLRERAAAFAADFAHWFADDGAAIPYGRSLIYRFAQAGFWGALAFADVEALPWGQVKGLLLRHLRHWARLPAVDEAGLLTIGYAYPDLNLTEAYNSPGSPYWAMKAFLPLALPGGHPFWRAEESGPPRLEPVRPQPHPGMVLVRDRTHAWALAGGQSGLNSATAPRSTRSSPTRPRSASVFPPAGTACISSPPIRCWRCRRTGRTGGCARAPRRSGSRAGRSAPGGGPGRTSRSRPP